MEPQFSAEFQRRTVLKASKRLLPLVGVAYVVSYVDRTNVAFASLTMNKDLGISVYYYGLGAGIFFLSYALFEVPSNIILERVGARVWIARIMFTWGIISGLMAFVTGPTSFLALRFLLGAAEAGFLPGVILYFTYWFPGAYRARVLSSLFVAIPAGNAVAAVASGAILGMDGIGGLRGWQWLFIIEAAPAVILSFVVLRMMTERPSVATWLTPDERQWLESELRAERQRIESAGRITMWRSLGDSRVLVLALIYFGGIIASYGMTFFLPQIVKGLGHSNFVTGLLTAIPYVVGVIGLVIWGHSSDRRKERRWHLIAASVVASAGLAAVGLLTGSHWAILAMAVAAIGIYGARPAFWPLPSQFLTGPAAAAGIALINAVGNVGGYVGPFIVGWIRESTNSFEMGLYFLAACSFASAIVAYAARRATGAPAVHEGGRAYEMQQTR